MSTKAIESVLRWVERGGHPDLEQALTELSLVRYSAEVLTTKGFMAPRTLGLADPNSQNEAKSVVEAIKIIEAIALDAKESK